MTIYSEESFIAAVRKISDGISAKEVLINRSDDEVKVLWHQTKCALQGGETDTSATPPRKRAEKEIEQNIQQLNIILSSDKGVADPYANRTDDGSSAPHPKDIPLWMYDKSVLGIQPLSTIQSYRTLLQQEYGWQSQSSFTKAIRSNYPYPIKSKIILDCLPKVALDARGYTSLPNHYVRMDKTPKRTISLLSPEAQQDLIDCFDKLALEVDKTSNDDKVIKTVNYPEVSRVTKLEGFWGPDELYSKKHMLKKPINDAARRKLESILFIPIKTLFSNQTELVNLLRVKRQSSLKQMGISDSDLPPYIIRLPELTMDENNQPSIKYLYRYSQKAIEDIIDLASTIEPQKDGLAR